LGFKMDMSDGDGSENRAPSRAMSAMGVEIEPDLEAPLLGTLESSKPPSRLAPLLVLLALILVVIALASMMGNLSSHLQTRISPVSAEPP